MSHDSDPMSEEEERRFDLVAVSVWFFAAALALFLLSILAIAAGVFSFYGGAHPTREPSDGWLGWTIACFATGLGLALGGGYLWRDGAR